LIVASYCNRYVEDANVMSLYRDSQSVIDAWHAGKLSSSEFAFRFLGTIRSDNARHVLSELPSKILALLKAEIELAPTSADGWSRFRAIDDCCSTEMQATLNVDHRARIEGFRAGVEAMRSFQGQVKGT
jgi:hypothetical protein